jgi:hypothetical protein
MSRFADRYATFTPRQILSGLTTVVWVGILAWQIAGYFLTKSDERTGGAAQTAAAEYDGDALNALMRGAHEAIRTRDPGRFQKLFADSEAGRSAWNAVADLHVQHGALRPELVTTPPQIERLTPDVRVEDLTIEAWYDIRDEWSRQPPRVYHTTWMFVRVEGAWKLRALLFDTSTLGYDPLIGLMLEMSHVDRLALDMSWEESEDVTPLIAGALRAVARRDLTAFQRCSLDGVPQAACDRGIEKREWTRSWSFSQRTRPQYLYRLLSRPLKKVWWACERLETSPTGLIPLFTAYRTLSMPPKCTQLAFHIGIDGSAVPGDVESFSATWCAAFVGHRWLLTSLDIEDVRRARRGDYAAKW